MRTLPARLSHARRLGSLGIGVVAASALVAGCGSGGTKAGATASTVADFVPAGAPMYFEVSTDFGGPQWQQVDSLAKLFPSYPKMRAQLDKDLSSGGVSFQNDVRPLLGSRAAMAVLKLPPASSVSNGMGSSSSSSSSSATTSTTGLTTMAPMAAAAAAKDADVVAVVSLASGKDAQAEALLAKESTGTPTEVDGVKAYKLKDKSGAEAAVMDGAIVMASNEADLKSALDAHKAGGSQTLAGNSRFTDTIAKLPADTFGQFYVDAGAVVQQQAADNAQLRSLGLADMTNARVAGSVAAEADGVRIKSVTVGATGQKQTEFSPTLVDKVPADAIAFADGSDLGGQVQQLLTAVRSGTGTSTSGSSQQFDQVLGQITPMLGVSTDDLKALVSKETGLVVTSGSEPGVVLTSQVADPARAQRTLDTLREHLTPLVAGLSQGTQKLPAWKQVDLAGGTTGWNLPLSTTGGVTYGIDGSLAYIGTNPAAVRAVEQPAQPLSQLADYTAAVKDMPSSVTGVAWMNGAETVRLVQAMGQAKTANQREALNNAKQIKNIVAWSTGGDQPTSEMFIRIAK